MPDYKEMYLKLFRASEQAVNIIIDAQRECEEMFLSAPEPGVTVLSFGEEHPKKEERDGE